ncbi:MAG: PilZ domain-containing protein [Desulfobacterales bacterium]|nr:PilZ domain-containing protein [Desulfobacterales bacterium]
MRNESGKAQGVIHNVSHGGVFVRCDGAFAAGQRLQLTIPLRKRQKIVTRVGEVVWSDRNGLGIRFDPGQRLTGPTPRNPFAVLTAHLLRGSLPPGNLSSNPIDRRTPVTTRLEIFSDFI